MQMLIRHLVAGALDWTGCGQLMARWLAKRYGGYIICYHDISENRFVEQIEALQPDRPVSLDELIARHRAGRSTAGMFAITFDDGFHDTISTVCPIARRQGWPVTIYLPTGFVNHGSLLPMRIRNLQQRLPDTIVELGGESIDLSSHDKRQQTFERLITGLHTSRGDLVEAIVTGIEEHAAGHGLLSAEEIDASVKPVSWKMVEQLSACDEIDFESHGVSHDPVVALSVTELEQELIASKQEIARHTGREVKHFCYPFGGTVSIGDQAPAIVARHYQTAVTLCRGRLAGSDLYRLPRVPLYQRDTGRIAMLKVVTATGG
jgi:peptidoglycan/xylan/chitin deacetylase (PgdA/CDA1 family)